MKTIKHVYIYVRMTGQSNSHVHYTVTEIYTSVYFPCVCFPVFFFFFFSFVVHHCILLYTSFLSTLKLSTFTFVKGNVIHFQERNFEHRN